MSTFVSFITRLAMHSLLPTLTLLALTASAATAIHIADRTDQQLCIELGYELDQSVDAQLLTQDEADLLKQKCLLMWGRR